MKHFFNPVFKGIEIYDLTVCEDCGKPKYLRSNHIFTSESRKQHLMDKYAAFGYEKLPSPLPDSICQCENEE